MKHGINLTLRAPNVLSHLRAAVLAMKRMIPTTINCVQDYNIDVLTNVGNLHETFVRFDMKNRRVITERNAKTEHCRGTVGTHHNFGICNI